MKEKNWLALGDAELRKLNNKKVFDSIEQVITGIIIFCLILLLVVWARIFNV